TEIVDKIEKRESLLTTHDCVYYKQRLPLETRRDLYFELNKTFPYLNFEEEEIVPIAEQSFLQQRYAEIEEFEERHRQHIIAEEILAKDYFKNINT
ncbi:MAG: hypothetical protein KGI88_08085, partial [Betaproteobacteria bacterium]|nr:hypothetical protein [Betaproteobacteria bacterium]